MAIDFKVKKYQESIPNSSEKKIKIHENIHKEIIHFFPFTNGSDYPKRDIKGERVDDCSMTEKKLNYRNLLIFQAFWLYGLIPNNIFLFFWSI